MNYKQALRYLDSFINYERRVSYPYKNFKLQRMEELLARLGNPHRQFKSIHIAGTKGKGSTCATIYSILRQAGYKVGLYISPHLVDFRERIRVSCGKNYNLEKEKIPKRVVCELLEFMKPHIEAQNRDKKLDKLSFFEVYTALAFLYFAKEKVDYAVVEVGLGGRLDATNVIMPEVCGITHIGLDHMSTLGNTVEKIAKEKAGIIKKCIPVVCARQKKNVLNIIKKTCKDKNARLFAAGKGLQYKSFKSDLLGAHQLENIACAMGIINVLKKQGAEISAAAIRKGIAKVNWPGRLQVISKKPLIVLDGAHNKSSAQALRKAIKSLFPSKDVILIFGISTDKDIKGVGNTLFPIAKRIILTKAENPRAASVEYLSKIFSDYKFIKTNNVKQALKQAAIFNNKNSLILVAGSFYVIGEILAGSNFALISKY